MKWFTHYFKRYSVIFVSNIIIVLLAFWQFTSGEALTAFILMWGLLISWIFMVGYAIHFDCVKTETITD